MCRLHIAFFLPTGDITYKKAHNTRTAYYHPENTNTQTVASAWVFAQC